MRFRIALPIAAAWLLGTMSAIATGPVMPVLVGGNDGLDACMTLGAVTGLNPNGDNFLAVREGPGTTYDKIDEVLEGQELWICDEEGDWYGVVYGGNMDCGVSSPIEQRNPYDGPCTSGWVSAKYVEIIAG